MKTMKSIWKVPLIAIVVIAAFALTACKEGEYVMNMTVMAANVTTLDKELDQAREVIKTNLGTFSLDEQKQLEKADLEIRGLQRAARSLVEEHGSVASALVKADQIRYLVVTARSAYRNARGVICPGIELSNDVSGENCPRLAEMDSLDRFTLISMDTKARRTGKGLDELLNAEPGTDVTQIISDVLSVGAMAAKILAL